MTPYILPGLSPVTIQSLTLAGLLDAISSMTGVSVPELSGKRRKREITVVRQVYMYLAKEKELGTLKEIGSLVNRDHATVLYAHKTVKDGIEMNDSVIIEVMNKINKIIE